MKTLLFKPFERYNPIVLILIGVIAAIIGSFFAYWFEARYDGVLDLHFLKQPQVQEPFLDNLINILTMSALLLAGGQVINRKTRLIDILAAVLVSRIPFYLIPLINVGHNLIPELDPNDLEAVTAFAMENIVQLVLMALVIILFVVWSVALLYNGFRIACNAKGWKGTVLFIAAILVAEITSKILIYHFN